MSWRLASSAPQVEKVPAVYVLGVIELSRPQHDTALSFDEVCFSEMKVMFLLVRKSEQV